MIVCTGARPGLVAKGDVMSMRDHKGRIRN